MEDRLIQLENAGQKFSPTEGRIKGLEKSLSKLDREIRALREQLNQQSKKIDRNQKKTTPPVATKKPQVQKRYHEVSRGETLFGIAKKYGVPVDDLRRLNKLSKSAGIYPGQKIMIP